MSEPGYDPTSVDRVASKVMWVIASLSVLAAIFSIFCAGYSAGVAATLAAVR